MGITIFEILYFCCFQAEQSQSNILEKALVTEKDNFHRLKVTLDNERIRSRDAIDRDNDTILDLRTALEVKKFSCFFVKRSQSASLSSVFSLEVNFFFSFFSFFFASWQKSSLKVIPWLRALFYDSDSYKHDFTI